MPFQHDENVVSASGQVGHTGPIQDRPLRVTHLEKRCSGASATYRYTELTNNALTDSPW
jgi:hypothetical protein